MYSFLCPLFPHSQNDFQPGFGLLCQGKTIPWEIARSYPVIPSEWSLGHLLGEGQGKVFSFVEMYQQTKYPTDPTLFSSIVGGTM